MPHLPSLFGRSSSGSGCPPPPAPRIQPKSLPFDSPRDPFHIYQSDSELHASSSSGRKRKHERSSSRNSVTPRPPPVSRTHNAAVRATTESKPLSRATWRDNSSRSRDNDNTPKQPLPKVAKPLKPCLKQPKQRAVAVPDQPRGGPAPSLEDLAQEAVRAGYVRDSTIHTISTGSTRSQHRLDSRQSRGRYDSAPSGQYVPVSMSSRTRHQVSHGSSGSDTSTESRPSDTGLTTYKGRLKVESISLHPILTGKFSKRPHLPFYFDVAFDPRRPGNVNQHQFQFIHGHPENGKMVTCPVPSATLEAPASTHTELYRMTIECPRGPLGRAPIVVERRNGIRCIDVLVALYDVYNRIVSPDDLLHIDPGYLESCLEHFRTRCEDVANPSNRESRWGMKYVDLLRGSMRRWFKGLVQRGDHANCWDLYFEDPNSP